MNKIKQLVASFTTWPALVKVAAAFLALVCVSLLVSIFIIEPVMFISMIIIGLIVVAMKVLVDYFS